MTQTIPLGSDARERFVLEIAKVLPPERIVEAHFFAPLRQGQIETGVCVLGALPEGAEPDATPSEVVDDAVPPHQDAEPATAHASADPYPAGARISSRHVVYSARYRWTRKGPERGRWECEVIAEADAPLLAVEAVVQGVQRRAAELLEVQKLDGDTVREMIAKAQRQWQKTA